MIVIAAIVCIAGLTTDLVESEIEPKRTCHSNYYKPPQCVDTNNGYHCECSPGFFWNTQTCVALGIDSRLHFPDLNDTRYNLLQGKTFPSLESWTVAFWLRIKEPSHPSTVLSYKHNDNGANLLRIQAGPYLVKQVHKVTIKSTVLAPTEWMHVAWTADVPSGEWVLYINARKHSSGKAAMDEIPGGGKLVIGQSSRTVETKKKFAYKENAFLGELAFVNIWREVLTKSEVDDVYHDCAFKQCGSAVEWADFRQGTRGDMRIRWPSKIVINGGLCFTEEESKKTCDQYCSRVIGPQCKAEVVNNIEWKRIPANASISEPCPNRYYGDGRQVLANRSCHVTTTNEGVWSKPLIGDCMTSQQKTLLEQISYFSAKHHINGSAILEWAQELANFTATANFQNPTDIYGVVEAVKRLIHSQRFSLSATSPRRGYQYYANKQEDIYPTYRQTELFAERVVTVLDQLADRNEEGWKYSKPLGYEADRLLSALEEILDTLATSLLFHVRKGEIDRKFAKVSINKHIISLSTGIYKPTEINEIKFPGTIGNQEEGAYLRFSGSEAFDHNLTDAPVYYQAMTTQTQSKNVNHSNNYVLEFRRHKDDNLNSALFIFMFHNKNLQSTKLTHPISVHLPYANSFNISNPYCVTLRHAAPKKHWNWTRNGCSVTYNSSKYAGCSCWKSGIFAVTTDMYNVDWDPGIRPIILMQIPSYIGCGVSAFLCFVSLLLLVVLRTSTSTALVHKHFALSLTLSQLFFMFGIDKLAQPLTCKVMAVSIHYFFLSAFLWLMNETFALYIMITYAHHSGGEHTGDAGSTLRYHLIGWLMPGIMVGAFVGTHTTNYYATDMCMIAWEHSWLMLAPAIAIMSVTVLVLIFIIKEHVESSYTKIQYKGLWTQVILLSMMWVFAFLSVKMHGIIVKVLYALFSCLQGAFFFVFYFLLNDEVRAVYLAHKKQENLNKQVFDMTDSPSEEHELHNFGVDRLVLPGTSDAATATLDESGGRSLALRRGAHRAHIEASSDEEDDSEEEALAESVVVRTELGDEIITTV